MAPKKKKDCGKNLYMVKIANIEPDLIMESTKAPKATMALMAPMAPKKKKDCGKNLYMVKIANIEPDLIMESTKALKATMALMAPMAPKKKKGLWKKPVYGQDREYRTGFNYGVNKGTKGNDGTDGTNGTEEKKGLW